MIGFSSFSASAAIARRPSRAAVLAGMSMAAGLAGCSPYPDDGEFLANVVFAGKFIDGVKNVSQTPAVGRGAGAADFAPYTVIATGSASSTTQPVSGTSPAAAPFWTNGGKRQPLDRKSAQPVYVFDGSCAAPRDYEFDARIDLIRYDRQYPLFSDLPEVLSANAGRAGRTGSYSAVVELIHLSGSGALPCQSIKRFDTAKGRTGEGGDLREGRHEYRLLQIIDPAIAVPPLPVQLGFFNQLVVPYIDMGPVPLEADGKSFRTMPVYSVNSAPGKLAGTVVLGLADEAGAAYSPICREYTLTLMNAMTLPLDAGDPVLSAAMKTENLSSCLVCRTVDAKGNLSCPFADSQGMP